MWRSQNNFMELHLTGPGPNKYSYKQLWWPSFFHACCCEFSSGSSCILSRCPASSGPLGIPSCPLCPSIVLIKIMLNWGFAEYQISWQSNSRKDPSPWLGAAHSWSGSWQACPEVTMNSLCLVCPEAMSASRSCQVDHLNHHGGLVLVL